MLRLDACSQCLREGSFPRIGVLTDGNDIYSSLGIYTTIFDYHYSFYVSFT